MRSSTKANEKLGAICIWTCICHRQDSFMSMWIPNLLICKLLSVNASASSTISCGDVATLCHESFNHSMEKAVFISKVMLILAGGDGQEIGCSLGYLFGEDLKHDSTFPQYYSRAPNFKVKEDLSVLRVEFGKLVKDLRTSFDFLFIVEASSKCFLHGRLLAHTERLFLSFESLEL